MSTDLDLLADCLEKARNALARYLSLIQRILGSTPEEVRMTLSAMDGLTPEEIRDCCLAYKTVKEAADG